MIDLRERLQAGDFTALTDPALPLHLLAEPDAAWWRVGAVVCCLRIFRVIDQAMESRSPAANQIKSKLRRAPLLSEDGEALRSVIGLVRRFHALSLFEPAEVAPALDALAGYAGADPLPDSPDARLDEAIKETINIRARALRLLQQAEATRQQLDQQLGALRLGDEGQGEDDQLCALHQYALPFAMQTRGSGVSGGLGLLLAVRWPAGEVPWPRPIYRHPCN